MFISFEHRLEVRMGQPATVVGRDRQLTALRDALDEAHRGNGRLVLLAGEPGIGKSTVIEAFCDEARARGATVLWGAGWDGGGAPVYWPWVQVLRAAPEPGRSMIAALDLDLSGPAGRQVDRFSLFDAVTQVLQAVAEPGPLVVALDDLHVAGVASVLLLAFVARHTRRSPVVLIGTYRDVEVRLDAELMPVMRELESVAVQLELAPFDRRQVEQVLGGSVAQLTDDLVAEVFERTQGNPLFVAHVARQLATRDGGSAADLPIPPGLRQAIRRRTEHVATVGSVPRCLDVAAVLGAEIDVRLLAAVLGATPSDVQPVLDAAVDAGLVQLTAGGYAFSHARVRETLYGDQPPAARAALHLTVAHRLGELDTAGPARIAYHYFSAWPAGGAEQAATYAARAGDDAMAALAYEDAVGHYRQALVSLGRFATDSTRERCDMLLRLGSALLRSGLLDELRREVELAAELADRLGDPELASRAALLGSEHLAFNAVDEPAIARLRRAEAAWGERRTPLRARVLARLAVIITQPAAAEALELADAAIAVGEESGDAASLAVALSARLHVLRERHEPRDARLVAQRMDALARSAADARLALDAQLWTVVFALEDGDLEAAAAAVDEMDRLAGELRQPTVRHLALSRRSTLYVVTGRLDEALALAREAWEIGRRCGLPDADAVYWGQLFAIWRLRRLPDADAQHMESMLRHLVEHSALRLAHEPALVLILLARETRDARDDAVRRFARLMPHVPHLPRDMLYLFVLVTLADACVELADAGAAAVLYDALRPFAARFTVAAGAVACLGSVELQLGALAALLGDDAAARRHFDAAVRIHRSARAPGFLARSCRAYAEHLDRPADAALARSLRDEAQRLAIAYGLTPTPDVALTVQVQRDGAVWTVRRGTAVVRLPGSRGLGYLAALVGNPGRDISAVQLAGLSGDDGAAPAPAFEDGLASPAASSFDPVLDERARAAYRQRLRDLEQDIDEAAGWHDAGRLAQLKAERDFLVRELASSLGLGGRARRFTSDAEKARVNVTRAIRSAIAKIAEQAPDLGEHLSTAISTGYNCRYEPALTRTARV